MLEACVLVGLKAFLQGTEATFVAPLKPLPVGISSDVDIFLPNTEHLHMERLGVWFLAK